MTNTKADQVAHPEPASHSADLQTEDEQRLTLLEASYKEVLDATKHQDDKIGRLLTAIAFLTAAVLALANLRVISGPRGESESALRTTFEINGHPLPLALIFLSLFLGGVFLSVVLLVMSFATPLRLPGIQPSQGSKSDRGDSEIDWAAGVKGSQIYFSEISRLRLASWRKKWGAHTDDLKREKIGSLIAEVHNLSVRTNFKYNRTTEAVGVLHLGLLGFALSIFFVALGATELLRSEEWVVRGGTAAIVGLYVILQNFSRSRYEFQTIAEPWTEDSPVGAVNRLIERASLICGPSVYIIILLLSPYVTPESRIGQLVITGALVGTMVQVKSRSESVMKSASWAPMMTASRSDEVDLLGRRKDGSPSTWDAVHEPPVLLALRLLNAALGPLIFALVALHSLATQSGLHTYWVALGLAGLALSESVTQPTAREARERFAHWCHDLAPRGKSNKAIANSN